MLKTWEGSLNREICFGVFDFFEVKVLIQGTQNAKNGFAKVRGRFETCFSSWGKVMLKKEFSSNTLNHQTREVLFV